MNLLNTVTIAVSIITNGALAVLLIACRAHTHRARATRRPPPS